MTDYVPICPWPWCMYSTMANGWCDLHGGSDDTTIPEHVLRRMEELEPEAKRVLARGAFLRAVYDLCDAGKDDAAIDSIFDYVDDLLCEGSFDAVDDALRRIELDRLSTAAMIGFLSITLAARPKLPYRSALCQAIRDKLADDPQVDELLNGLE